MGAVIHGVRLGVDEANVEEPVPRLFGPVAVRLVARVSREACANVEEAAVGDGVLIIIAPVQRGNLPSQPAPARVVVPVRRRLRVEDGLREGQILRLARGWVREPALGAEQGRHAPKRLVVVAQRGRVVERHEIPVVARLVQDRLHHVVVVRRVARVEPIVDHGAPERAALPPVVVSGGRRAREDPRDLAGFVAVIVGQEVVG
jgi:hypothetical protein